MKSVQIEKKAFSMEDFEKGLMLAGYLMPQSILELNEREALEKYETELKSSKKNIYFKRVVLAAEIVSKLYNEPTLGRIKFQKLVYLCEHVAHMNLESRYSKQAAGPFDSKFMHSIEKEFKTNKWFSVLKLKDGKFTRSKYIPLENCDGYKKYYCNYFERDDAQIQFIIELFRARPTDYTELAATVFACYLEILSKKEDYSPDKLLYLFYNWSETKLRFDQNEVLNSFAWLQNNGLVPSD